MRRTCNRCRRRHMLRLGGSIFGMGKRFSGRRVCPKDIIPLVGTSNTHFGKAVSRMGRSAMAMSLGRPLTKGTLGFINRMARGQSTAGRRVRNVLGVLDNRNNYKYNYSDYKNYNSSSYKYNDRRRRNYNYKRYRWSSFPVCGGMWVDGAFNRVFHLAAFKRDRKTNINNIVSNFPTKVSVSVRFIRRRLGHHQPKRDRVAAPHGRTSRIRFLSKVFRKGSAKYPVKFLIHGAGRRSASCSGVHSLCHPSRTSFACARGCNIHSRHNNNHSSTHRAVSHYMKKTLTGLTLHQLKIRVCTCASRMKCVTLRRSCARCASVSLVKDGIIQYPSDTGTTRVRRLVTRMGTRKSAVNNVVAKIIERYPVKLNRPSFKGLRTTLKDTVLDVGTIGNFRCKRKFTNMYRQKDRRGSVFATRGKRVAAHAGHDKNVRNNVDGKRSVCFQITFGPITALLVRRRAIAGSNTPAVLGTHKQRSTYILPHTIPVMRTVTTVAVLSFCLRGGTTQLLWRKCRGTAWGDEGSVSYVGSHFMVGQSFYSLRAGTPSSGRGRLSQPMGGIGARSPRGVRRREVHAFAGR